MQKSVSPEATMAHDAEDCEFAARLCSPMRENDGDSARLAALTDNVAVEFWNACRSMEDGPSGGRCNPEPCLPGISPLLQHGPRQLPSSSRLELWLSIQTKGWRRSQQPPTSSVYLSNV